MIDAGELKEALDAIEHMPRGRYADLILSAARAHLATLPRWKDIEVEQWAVIDSSGSVQGVYDDLTKARAAKSCDYLVRLTGTVKVKV